MEEQGTAERIGLGPELECVCSGVRQTEEVRGTSVIRLITLVISPAMQVTGRSVRLPGWKCSGGGSSSPCWRWHRFAPAVFPQVHTFPLRLSGCFTADGNRFSDVGVWDPGDSGLNRLSPWWEERLSSLQVSCAGGGRQRGGGCVWWLACALFIRRLPSRCLPGRSQTGLS